LWVKPKSPPRCSSVFDIRPEETVPPFKAFQSILDRSVQLFRDGLQGIDNMLDSQDSRAGQFNLERRIEDLTLGVLEVKREGIMQ